MKNIFSATILSLLTLAACTKNNNTLTAKISKSAAYNFIDSIYTINQQSSTGGGSSSKRTSYSISRTENFYFDTAIADPYIVFRNDTFFWRADMKAYSKIAPKNTKAMFSTINIYNDTVKLSAVTDQRQYTSESYTLVGIAK